jgi:hypothetical protein
MQAVGLVIVLACNHANLLAPSNLATAGSDRAAWGTLPTTDLFPIIFSSTMSEKHLRDWMPHRGGRGRVRMTTLRKAIAVSLYVLSANDAFHRCCTFWGQDVASSASVHEIVKRVAQTVNELSDTYIFWPSDPDQAKVVVDGIEALRGLPCCIGIVDGTHVEIPGQKGGRLGGKQYISYKKRYTLIMQGVVDGTGLFTHVVAGFPGSMNDATIFARSGVYRRLADTIYEPGYPGKYILGDSAYDSDFSASAALRMTPPTRRRRSTTLTATLRGPWSRMRPAGSKGASGAPRAQTCPLAARR